jgi:hypothetical protein
MTPKFLLRFPDNPAVEYHYTLDELKAGYRTGRFTSACKVRQEPTHEVISWEVLMATGNAEVAAVAAVPVKPELSSDALPTTPIERSGVAVALSVFGVLELIASPIAAFLWGREQGHFSWVIFWSGLIGGLLFLGFAKAIDLLNEMTQRLRAIESAARGTSRERPEA